MTAILSPTLRYAFFKVVDGVLVPLAGGFLYTYASGTSTPLGTWKNAAQSAANDNPIELDDNGQCDLWLGTNAYKFDLFDLAMVRQPGYPVDAVDPTAYSNDALLAQTIACFAGEIPPTNPVQGQLWYQPSAAVLSQYSGTAWVAILSAANLVNQTYTAFTTAGTAPNFTFTPSTAILAYSANQRYRVKWSAGAGSPTMNVSGLGAQNVKHYNSRGAKIASTALPNVIDDMEFDGFDQVMRAPHIPRNDGPVVNYRAVADGASASFTMAADRVTLRDAAGGYVEIASASAVLNTATGIDTGALAGNTWYYKFFIYDPSTDALSTLFSLSATSPTLPAGYTHFRRMGSFRTDGTANKYPLGCTWANGKVQYRVNPVGNTTAWPSIATGTTAGATLALTNFVPPTATEASIRLNAAGVTTTVVEVFPSSNGNSIARAVGNAAAQGIVTRMVLLEAYSVYWTSSGSASNAIACTGWEEPI